MGPELLFFGFLALTLAALGGATYTGFRAQRREHFACVGAAVLMLVLSIWAALRVGEHYDLSKAGMITTVHLRMSRYTTGAYLLPVVTGLMTLRDSSRKRLHRYAAFTALGLTVATAITGTWMLLAAEKIS